MQNNKKSQYNGCLYSRNEQWRSFSENKLVSSKCEENKALTSLRGWSSIPVTANSKSEISEFGGNLNL